MKKRCIQIPFALLAIIIFLQFPGASDEPGQSRYDESDKPVVETFPERSPGEFDAVAYAQKKRELFARLMSGRVGLTAEETIVVEVTPEEIEQIKNYKCEDCGDLQQISRKIRVGIVKPVGVEVDFKGLTMEELRQSARSYAGGFIYATDDGGFVWEMAIRSPDAVGLRVNLTNFNLFKNTELYVYSDEGSVFGPYTFMGLKNEKDFWSHTVFGSTVYLHLRHIGLAKNRDLHAVHFLVKDLGHLTAKFRIALFRKIPHISSSDGFGPPCDYNADCIEDAYCYDGAPVDTLKDAVALIQFVSGAWLYTCSGGLLNDTDDSTQIPYFFTANHCISRPKEAKSMEAYWQYINSSCNGCNPIGPIQQTLGADILSTSSRNSDYCFMQLRENPPSGSFFLGWITNDIAYSNENLYRVSHPQGAPQGYSVHAVDVDADTCGSWPRGKWIYSRDSLGATEGGSSGSPVVNGAGQVVGQLTGTCGYNVNDPCDNVLNATVDGAFANYFPEIEQWLDPGTSSDGTMHVDSIVLNVEAKGKRYEAIAHVTIVDENGDPVSRAEVSGIFSGDASGTKSTTTDKNGVATLKIGQKNSITTFTFCVDDVTHSSFIYDSDANVETCDTY